MLIWWSSYTQRLKPGTLIYILNITFTYNHLFPFKYILQLYAQPQFKYKTMWNLKFHMMCNPEFHTQLNFLWNIIWNP